MTTRQPIWIEEGDVLTIHDRLLAIHGGAPGLRDQGLLQSALARPRQYHAYANSRDIIAMAALYTAGFVGNHPFVDGPKRTGFVVGVLFLELNGFRFKATEEDATRAVLDLAAGALDETEFDAWLRSNAKSRRAGATSRKNPVE